ncbi:hypothetical protein D3C85_1010090 [compost metagenome]
MILPLDLLSLNTVGYNLQQATLLGMHQNFALPWSFTTTQFKTEISWQDSDLATQQDVATAVANGHILGAQHFLQNSAAWLLAANVQVTTLFFQLV